MGGKHEEADKKLTDDFEFEDEFEEETMNSKRNCQMMRKTLRIRMFLK